MEITACKARDSGIQVKVVAPELTNPEVLPGGLRS